MVRMKERMNIVIDEAGAYGSHELHESFTQTLIELPRTCNARDQNAVRIIFYVLAGIMLTLPSSG